MDKLEKFYETYGDELILSTGEIIDVDEFYNMLHSIKKDDVNAKKRDGLKKLKAMKGEKRHFSKEKEGRIFGMIYEFDYNDKNLTIEEEGLYSILRKNIQLDGSGFVVIKEVHTKMQLAEYCGISKNKIVKLLDNLENKKLIKVINVGRNISIYINPYYYRISRWCDEKTVQMFNLSPELFD